MEAVDENVGSAEKDAVSIDMESESNGSDSNTHTKQSESLTTDTLIQGFTSELLPQLQLLREKTKELTRSQAVLIETIQHENMKYSENKEIEEFTKMIATVQLYYAKLKNIKSEMDQLDDRLGKLKKRSLKLKEKRQKRDVDEAQKRERELALERELTAKPAT